MIAFYGFCGVSETVGFLGELIGDSSEVCLFHVIVTREVDCGKTLSQ